MEHIKKLSHEFSITDEEVQFLYDLLGNMSKYKAVEFVKEDTTIENTNIIEEAYRSIYSCLSGIR